ELRAKAPGFVQAKQRVTAGDASVSLVLQRGVHLTGTVTCEKVPVVGATVIIRGGQTKTGTGGHFEFDAAHAPAEIVSVSAPSCCSQGVTLALSLAVPVRDVTIELEAAGSVAGHVSALTGGAVA